MAGKVSDRAEINVTPLIDILLVLLIVFMLITPLASHGISAALPQAPPNNLQWQEQPLVLHVSQDDALSINNEKLTRAELPARLKQIFANRAAKQLFIAGDGPVEYQQIALAMDAAQGADLSLQFGLMPAKQ